MSEEEKTEKEELENNDLLDEENQEEEIDDLEEKENPKKDLESRSQTLVDNTVRIATDMGREAVICTKYEKFKEKALPIILGVISLIEEIIPIPFNLIPKIIKSGLEVMQKSNSVKEIFENIIGFAGNVIKSLTQTFSKNEMTTDIIEKGADTVTGFLKSISEPIAKTINNFIDKKKSTNLQTQQLSGAGNEFDSLISNQQETSLTSASQDMNIELGLDKTKTKQDL